MYTSLNRITTHTGNAPNKIIDLSQNFSKNQQHQGLQALISGEPGRAAVLRCYPKGRVTGFDQVWRRGEGWKFSVKLEKPISGAV